MMKMRESIEHWILIHEHPFTVVKEEGHAIIVVRAMKIGKKLKRFVLFLKFLIQPLTSYQGASIQLQICVLMKFIV